MAGFDGIGESGGPWAAPHAACPHCMSGAHLAICGRHVGGGGNDGGTRRAERLTKFFGVEADAEAGDCLQLVESASCVPEPPVTRAPS